MTNMKKKRLGMIFLILLGILIIGGGGYFAIKAYQGSSIGGVQVVGKYAYGWISCEPSTQPVQSQTPINIVGNPSVSPTAYNQGDISNYQLTVATPSVSVTGCTSYTCPKYRLIYSICKIDGSGCSPKDSTPITCNPTTSGFYYQTVCSAGSSVLTTATNKDYVAVSWQSTKCRSDSGFFSCLHDTADGWTFESGASYTTVYYPFSLWRTDITNGGHTQITGTNTCASPIDIANQFGGKLIISSSLADLNKIQSASINRLQPYQTWNYVSDIIQTVQEVEIYNGQEAICTDKTMYGLGSAQTADGQNLKIMDKSKNLGAVECCKSDVQVGYVCQDHKYVSTSSPTTQLQCSLTNPCPLSTWNVDTSDPAKKTIFEQQCVQNICQSVKQTVECTDSSQCPEGNRCGGDYKCQQTSVQGSGLVKESCGDNICGINENVNTCPADCKVGNKQSSILFYTFLISLILVLIIAFIYNPIKNIWGRIITSVIVAVIIAVAITFIMKGLIFLIQKIQNFSLFK